MSTFPTYNSIIENKIANTSEVFYTNEMKRQAVNEATKELLQQYDIPEFVRKPSTTGELTVASGKADFPSDFFRVVKFWLEDTNGVQKNEFVYNDPADFDGLADGDSYFWTVDYDFTDDTRKFFFKPITETSIFFRYVKTPTEITDDSTDNGLSSQWDDTIAYLAAARLFQNSGRYDEAQFFEQTGNSRVRDVFLALKNPGGWKADSRFRSKYERISQLW